MRKVLHIKQRQAMRLAGKLNEHEKGTSRLKGPLKTEY
jgi:hypothetical protein